MENTHPFVDDQDNPKFALIHNGVIYNHDQFKKIHSTCDSEVILHQYIKEHANLDATNMSNFTKRLTGWYTCATLAHDANNKPIIDFFAGDSARLASFFFPQLGVRVYSSEASDIKSAAAVFGLQTTDMQKLDQCSFMRICADTGEILQEGDVTTSKGDVYSMEGNFDDERFVENFFRGAYSRFGGSDV